MTASTHPRPTHRCPVCGAPNRIPDHGLTFQCGRCHAWFRLPGAAAPKNPPPRDPAREIAKWQARHQLMRATGAVAVVIAVMSILARLAPIPTPSRPNSSTPTATGATAGWPPGSTPAQMCATHQGVEIWHGQAQVYPAGGATRRDPLPRSSEVVCTDGSTQSISP
jgi:hypothetical protein